jgi:ABC-type multidrug transport system fused ATPase/permease subunit
VIKLVQLGLTGVMAPLSIYFIQQVIDAASGVVAHGASWRPLAVWCACLLGALLFNSTEGGFLDGILFIAIKRRLNHGMTPNIADKFKRLEYACFEDKDVQDTLQRMSSDPQDKVFQLFLSVTGALSCIIAMAGSAVVFAQAGWWFMAGFLALLAPTVWLDFKAADMMNTMFNSQSTDERRMRDLGNLVAGKAALFELKLFGATDYIMGKWRGLARHVLSTRLKTTFRSQRYYLASLILFKIWTAFIMITLVSAAVRGDMTIGLFTALIASIGAVLSNAELLSHTLQRLRSRYLLMDHYYAFLALPEAAYGNKNLGEGPLRVEFDQVVFTYPKTGQPVLNGVSFTVEPGERVSLVGENGAGKSTIIKLLCRLYEPDSGRILVNGIPIRELRRSELQRVFSVIFQDYQRYELSLRENVALSDLSKLEDNEALRAALVMGMAEDIADNLDVPLGKLDPAGRDLSGGQWQRVALARACLPDSAFVILDEPAAALDPLAESRMYESFARVLANRGCILISHRLASARMADKIVVLADGIVAESGDHRTLMEAGGLYARMYDSQRSWYVKEAAVS